MPDAAGEIAYTAAAFSRPVSFSTGWMMMLAYFIVCPWEAVAVGRIAGYIVPSLDSIEIYRIAGRPVYLPHLIIGLGLTALLTTLNYRGIRLSATFQNWTAFGTLALFIVFVALGVSKGSPQQLSLRSSPTRRWFRSCSMVQIVPYFMTGFESVSKAAEESTPEFRSQRFLKAIWMAILVGILFYTIVIAAVAFVAPWHESDRREVHDRGCLPARRRLALDRQHHPGGRTAVALQMLQRKFRSRQPTCCLLWDAAAWSTHAPAESIPSIRRRPSRFSASDWPPPRACCWETRSWCPITEVGSVACAIGWAATCAAYLSMGRSETLPGQSKLSAIEWLVAGFGLLVAIAMMLMKVVPAIPGHFTVYEWLALGIWIALGAISHRREKFDGGTGWRCKFAHALRYAQRISVGKRKVTVL